MESANGCSPSQRWRGMKSTLPTFLLLFFEGVLEMFSNGLSTALVAFRAHLPHAVSPYDLPGFIHQFYRHRLRSVDSDAESIGASGQLPEPAFFLLRRDGAALQN
jgi:hypothetical protein